MPKDDQWRLKRKREFYALGEAILRSLAYANEYTIKPPGLYTSPGMVDGTALSLASSSSSCNRLIFDQQATSPEEAQPTK